AIPSCWSWPTAWPPTAPCWLRAWPPQRTSSRTAPMCWTLSSPRGPRVRARRDRPRPTSGRLLRGGTVSAVGHLTPTAGLLFAFLCRLEPDDRRQEVVAANWRDVLTRLGEGHTAAVAALAEPEQGVLAALAALEAASLVAVERPALDAVQRQ